MNGATHRWVKLAATVVMAGLVVGPGHAAYADNNPQPWVQFEIFPPFFNTNAPKCLDVPNGSATRGTPLQVFHCHGFDSNGAPQLWFFENLGTDNSGPYQIRNKASQLCINIVLNTEGAPGTPAIENTCFGADTGLDVE